jgi:hypothetical protein
MSPSAASGTANQRRSRPRFVNRPVGWPLLAVVFVLVLTAGIASFARSANATTEEIDTPDLPKLGLRPVGQSGSYFDLTLAPGTTVTLTVVLSNGGEASQATRTFAANVYSLVNGGFGVAEESEPASGATTWLGYEPDSLDLAAGQIVERHFDVTVPPDAEPGQHITSLVLQIAEPIPVPGSDMFQQIVRAAIAVVITVPGPVTPGLALEGASVVSNDIGQQLVIGIANNGNIFLTPSGTVRISANDASRSESVITLPVTMGSIFPGTSTYLEIPLPDDLPLGAYSVSVELADTDAGANASALFQVTLPPNS